MSLHRRAAKRDAAEPEIVKTLEAHGCVVWRVSGKGLADLVVFYRKRMDAKGVFNQRHTFVADVKGPKEKATPAQEEKWGALTALGFAVFILRTPEDAVAMLNNALQPWEPEKTLPRDFKPAVRHRFGKDGCQKLRPCVDHDGAMKAAKIDPRKGDAAKARAEGRKRLGMGHAIEPLTNDASTIKARANYTPPRSTPVDAAKEAEAFAPAPKESWMCQRSGCTLRAVTDGFCSDHRD